MADSERRRRRQRQAPPAGGASPSGSTAAGRSAVTAEVHDPVPEPTGSRRGGGHGAGPGTTAEERDGERGLRGLVGSGSSQVSVGAALRARDASRPSEADLAEAEERLVVVRRNWVPREELPRNGR
ncbi:hypothetical protein AB0J86_13190 [Micromonospora sp. NPDC049559]|uniref:hypothetical protein n=1 Tax=Micromonospora sp. NPDC049559 TaxID=3155923 RepID=UPI00343CFB77